MNPLGIMVYGYEKSDAESIREGLEKSVNARVELVSGSGREEDKIRKILEEGGHQDYEARDTKVLMFLGFDGGQINHALNRFKELEGIDRPIFCTPTENNIGWTLAELIDDLLKEHEYWSEKG